MWAETLLASCGKGMYHNPNTKNGECVTENQGTGSFEKLQTPDEIIRRFVEREENWKPPKNSHLTQVLGEPPSLWGAYLCVCVTETSARDSCVQH